MSNVTVDNGTLTDYVVSTDAVAGEQVQIVKLMLGAATVDGGTVGAGTPMPVSGPLTDTQLRATAVPVSGTVTATGPLTDTQLRATAVPVSGPLTDTQLRATAVPVSGTVAVTGVATEATLATFSAKLPAQGPAAGAASQPVVVAVESASGSITTQNLVPAGVATAGSAVEITLNGANTLAAQVTGTYTGALSLQGTIDGTTWVTLGGTPFLNVNTGGMLATVTSALQTILQADVGGLLKARVTGLAAMTGTAVVTLRATTAASLVALDAPLPTGTATVGSIASVTTSIVPGTAATNLGKARDTAIGATDTGVAILGVRRDVPTAETPVAGDYIVPQYSQQGAAYAHPTFSGSAGATAAQIISAATTNATIVKASAGVLTTLAAVNNNTTTWRYLKLHNIATTPTAGTGVVLTYGIPPGGGIVLSFPSGVGFTTGIGATITGGIAAADATAIAASEVAVSLTFH